MAQRSVRALIHVLRKGHVFKIVTVDTYSIYIFNLPVVLEPIYLYTVLANILPFETLRKASFNIS